MDFGRDTIVVEWKARTSEMHAAMAKMRQDAQHTRAVMNAGPSSYGAALRRSFAAQHAELNLLRAEKNLAYELAKGHRWLRGQALQSFHDQVAAAKQLHAQRVQEIGQLSDIRQRELSLIDANNKLAQSLRQIASDARKASTDQRLAAGPGWGERFTRGVFGFVSWLRAVRYLAWVVRDAFLLVGRSVSFVINAFVALMRTWTSVVGTALKFGAAVGTAVVGALALATKQAVEFETAMLRVGGVLTQNLEQMGALERSIRGLAKATTISPSELALGAFSLASFGYGQKQTAGILPGVATLSMASSGEYAAAHGGMGGVTGGYMNVRRAAEAVARILLVYKMRASEAARVSNVLAAANAKSAATFERLYTALPRGLQAATLINTSFEELVATLSQLTNVGMEGGQAGPAFFGFVQRLIRPTKEMASVFEPVLRKLGLTMKDINPAIVGLRGSLLNLEKVYRNVSDATWANMVAVFRNRQGALALNALVKQGVAEHDRMTRAITGTNHAWQQASIMVSGVAGRWAFFLSSLKEFAITLTEKIRRPLAWFLDQLGRWINWLSSTPQVKALANALGQLAWNLARLGIRLLGMIDLKKAWPEFVSALAGYMRRAVRIITIGLGFIEYVFRSLVDPGSPLRQLWSSFWDFIEWSVKQGGATVVGALEAVKVLFSNIFSDMQGNAERFSQSFLAIMAETAKAVIALPFRMWQARNLQLIGEKKIEAMRLRDEAGIPQGAPVYGATPKGKPIAKLEREIKNLQQWATYAGKKAEEAEAGNVTGILATSRDRIKDTLLGIWGGFGGAQGPFRGVRRAYEGGKKDWLDMMGGGGGLPITNSVVKSLSDTVAQFVAIASNLKQRGNAAANMFGSEGGGMLARLSDDLEGSLDDNTDEVEGNTQQLERFNGKIDGLISKVIGAPLEALQRYVSPVTLAGAGGAGGIGPLMGLPGGPARPSAIYQTFNFDFGNGVKESFRYELTQGGGARLMDHKITNAFKQAIPALQGH